MHTETVKKILFILPLLSLQLLFAQSNAPMPIQLRFLSEKLGKPPLRWYGTDLTLYNNSDSIKWFLFPYFGDDTLKPDGIFKAEEDSKSLQVQGKKYPDSIVCKKQIVELEFYGAWKNDFRAFCLPAHSSVQLRDYIIDMNGEINGIEIWEVGRLLVNGKTPLDKWMPYNVLSSGHTFIEDCYDWHNLDWNYEKNTSRTGYREEKIKFIEAKGINKFWANIDKKYFTKADSLLRRLNQLSWHGGDKQHAPYNGIIEDSTFVFTDTRNRLDNLWVKFHWSRFGYVLSAYFPDELIEEMNKMVDAAGDQGHKPAGMDSLGESIVLFKRYKETLDAYGISYKWDETKKKYVLL